MKSILIVVPVVIFKNLIYKTSAYFQTTSTVKVLMTWIVLLLIATSWNQLRL